MSCFVGASGLFDFIVLDVVKKSKLAKQVPNFDRKGLTRTFFRVILVYSILYTNLVNWGLPMTLSSVLDLSIDLSTRRPLRDEAYIVLRRAILSGQFKPGERLIEREVAQRLGLSRSPVREAFRRLEQERLVTVTRQGVVVQALDPTEVEELYQVRQHLEVLVARLAARNFTSEHRRRLQENLKRMSAALTARDQARVATESVCFHRMLAEIAGNRRLARLLAAGGGEIQRFRSLNIQQGARTQAAVAEHRQIFAALAARDESRAAKLMAQHVEHSWAHAQRYV